MVAIAPLEPVGINISLPGLQFGAAPPAQSGSSFGDMFAAGLRDLDAKVAKADGLVEAYAGGAAIPVHEVTIALEQARLSVELAVEVRSRLLETYRDFMNMQL